MGGRAAFWVWRSRGHQGRFSGAANTAAMRSLAAALPVDGPSTALASLPGSLTASAIVAVCLAAALLAAVAALCAKTEPRPVAAQPPNNLNTAKVTIAAPAAPPPLEPKREPSVHAAVQVLGTAGRPDKAPADSDGVGSTSASAGGRSSTYDAMTSPSVAPKAPKVAAHGGRVGSYVPTSLGAANVYTAESGVNLTAGTFTNCSDSHAGAPHTPHPRAARCPLPACARVLAGCAVRGLAGGEGCSVTL